jgi:hypothetical protein
MLCLCSHRWEAEVVHQTIRKSSLEEGESSAPTPAALPWEKPRTQCAGSWVDLGADPEGTTNLLNRIQYPVFPACSESIYWLRYRKVN